MNVEHEFQSILTRRQFFGRAATGIGTLALASLLNERLFAAEAGAAAQARGILPALHFAPKAKRVIFLFMSGGPSHVDLFDPKPKLTELNGKPLPFEKPKLERTKTGNLFASPWMFARHGASGIDISELLPQLAGQIDDMCVIRSMVADNINHTGAALQMNTGDERFPRPSMGAWVTYGL